MRFCIFYINIEYSKKLFAFVSTSFTPFIMLFHCMFFYYNASFFPFTCSFPSPFLISCLYPSPFLPFSSFLSLTILFQFFSFLYLIFPTTSMSPSFFIIPFFYLLQIYYYFSPFSLIPYRINVLLMLRPCLLPQTVVDYY